MSKYKRIKISLAVMMSLSTVFTPQAFAVEHVFHRGFNGILSTQYYGGENSTISIFLMTTRTNPANNAKFLEIDSKSDGKGNAWALNPTHLGKVTEQYYKRLEYQTNFDPWNAKRDRCQAEVQNNCALNRSENWVRSPGLLQRHFIPKGSRSWSDIKVFGYQFEKTTALVNWGLSTSIQNLFIDVKGWSAIVDTVNNLNALGLTPEQKKKIVFEIEPTEINTSLPNTPIRAASLESDVKYASLSILNVAGSLTAAPGYSFLINVPQGSSGAIERLYNAAFQLHPSKDVNVKEKQIGEWVFLGTRANYDPKRGASRPDFWGWNMLSKYDNSRFHWFSNQLKAKIRYLGGSPSFGVNIMEWKPGPEAYYKENGVEKLGGITREGHCCFKLDNRATVADSSRNYISHLTYDEPDGTR